MQSKTLPNCRGNDYICYCKEDIVKISHGGVHGFDGGICEDNKQAAVQDAAQKSLILK